jgi:hypothetical protein
MSTLTTLYGVACEPPENVTVTQKTVAGLKIPDIKTGVKALRVVGDADICQKPGATHWLHPGATIYITNEALGSPWTKQVCEVDGLKFIVVPFGFIVGFKDGESVRKYSPTPPIDFNEPRP